MKYIPKKPKEDDPIFKQDFLISRPKPHKIDLVKIPKTMSRKRKNKTFSQIPY